MRNKQTAIEILESVINDKDQQIEELEAKLEKLEGQTTLRVWEWSIQKRVEDNQLPTPRLQLTCSILNDFSMEWVYSLVYTHTVGDVIEVPLSRTRIDGRSEGDYGPPFRDGVHIENDMFHFGMPGFIIRPDGVEEIVRYDTTTLDGLVRRLIVKETHHG